MDTDLVVRAQHGDKEAYALLAPRSLIGSLRSRAGSCATSTSPRTRRSRRFAVWQDLPTLRDPARFEAWSYRLLVRACYAEDSVTDLVSALTQQTGHKTTTIEGPSSEQVGGYPAIALEFSVPADFDPTSCDSGFMRLWPDAGPDEKYGLPIVPGQTMTIFVVDVDGQPQLIVGARKVGSSPTDVSELEQVIDSIQFE